MQVNMYNNDLLKECITLRDDLVKSLLDPLPGPKLQKKIDDFVAFTDSFLDDMGKFHKRAEKMCGKISPCDGENANFLDEFKDTIISARSKIDPLQQTAPHYDKTNEQWKELYARNRLITDEVIIEYLSKAQNYIYRLKDNSFTVAVERASEKGISKESQSQRH